MAESNYLNIETFCTVVANTPLISIDLIVQNEIGEVLLGLRRNRPARGFWFVPGGRIRKDEGLDAALTRLTREELGLALKRENTTFLGVYEHFYGDSIFDNANQVISTHYIVLAYKLALNQELLALPFEQHEHFRWWPLPEMQVSDLVHDNSRAYLSALKLSI